MDLNDSVFYPVGIMMVVVALGLVVRGRWRLSCFFAAYLAVALGVYVLFAVWPNRFFKPAFFMIGQSLMDIAKLGIVLEAAWRTFRVFPGAYLLARKAVVALLTATTVGALAVPIAFRGWDSYETALGQFQPIVLNGTIWLIVIVLAAAKWYRVPMHPFHTAVLTSLALYVAAFGTLLHFLVLKGFDEYRLYVSALDQGTYFLLTCWWAYVVWRPERAADTAHAVILRKLAFRRPVATS